MTNKKDSSLWEKEFLEFMDAKPILPPSHLSENIRTEIGKYQVILKWIVFSKFASIQAAFATLTLFLCPQFEIGFSGHDHLAALVQHHQGIAFMAICGAFFLSGGALLSTFLLNYHEIQIIKKFEWIYFPSATLIALLIFYLLGANLNWTGALPWFLGGVTGSILCFEITKRIKLQLRSKMV